MDEPLADAASPAQSRDLHGPTAVFNSALVYDHKHYMDGIALNLRIHPSAVSTEPVHIEKINAMATRIAKNLIKFAIKDLNPTTSTVNELITALQTIYA